MTYQRSVLLEIAAIVRRSHGASLAAIGWLAAYCSTAELNELLAFLQEWNDVVEQPTHYLAYCERWGRTPDTH